MKRTFMLRFPKLINFYPPFLGAGIRMTHLSHESRTIDVRLKRKRSTINYVGSHFGGSLFAMTDPFYMLLLFTALGKDYICWDKAASIRFRRPGVTDVFAHFHLSDDRLAEIKAALGRDGVHDVTFEVLIKDPDGNVVAIVDRTIYCATKVAHAARAEARKLKP